MSENWMMGRVRGLLGTPAQLIEGIRMDSNPESNVQRDALQVLTLAQRTAEEHVASAHRQGEKICAEARAKAEQILVETQAHANGLRREADKALADARTRATQIAREAQANAESARRNTDKLLTDAQVEATEIAKKAQANADELDLLAQQRYQGVVGTLAEKREALQRQIEALEEFDREYRARLTAFMQSQLRALWVDEPQVTADVERQPGVAPKNGQAPAKSRSTGDRARAGS